MGFGEAGRELRTLSLLRIVQLDEPKFEASTSRSSASLLDGALASLRMAIEKNRSRSSIPAPTPAAPSFLPVQLRPTNGNTDD